MRLLLVAEGLEGGADVRVSLARGGRVGEHRELLERDRADEEVAKVLVARGLGAGEGRAREPGCCDGAGAERGQAQRLAAATGLAAHGCSSVVVCSPSAVVVASVVVSSSAESSSAAT